MQYGLTKNLVFLLYENIYDPNNEKIEDDICKIIQQLQEEQWCDLYNNYDDCVKIIQSISIKPVYSGESIDNLIEYLKHLPEDILTLQEARQAIREESISAYMCKSG